jgi:hypothetical protein
MVWLSRRCFERLLVPFLPLSSENHFAQPMHYSQQIENINVKEFACVRACVRPNTIQNRFFCTFT